MGAAFPHDFVWGTATSSYQIEGGGLDHGRGECIWHRFSHTPGTIADGSNGDVACDHLHRYRDDVALMAGLGVDAYRFSIAWPRVLPLGTGAVNAEGLDFYDRLVDELLAHNITPFATLYHWDLPQALQDRGGWENPDSIGWFGDYAALMANRLGDRVTQWTTFNEPQVVAFAGNLYGVHAPGKQDHRAAYTVAHHLLIAHGAAVPIIRARVANAQVGITLDLPYMMPASDDEADARAAHRIDGNGNRWFLDPIFKGAYPADAVARLDDELAGLDLDAVLAAAAPIDFLGINYYSRTVYAANSEQAGAPHHIPMDDNPHTEMGWEVYPDGLRAQLVRLWQDYAPTSPRTAPPIPIRTPTAATL